MLTDCGGNVTWHNLNKATVKLNNGYIHIQQPPSVESITMDYESSSDAALLVQEQSQSTLNRDASTVSLLDVNQSQSQQSHSNITNNPSAAVVVSPVTASLTSPQHAVSSLRNSISPISTSPTNTTNKSQVIVNLDYPNSMQTKTMLQRNNVKNSSTNSNRSQTNVISTSNNALSSAIGNSIKSTGDNGKLFKANNRKYKFNLLKLSSSTRIERSTRIRLLILAVCLIVFGIAIGAFIVHMSGIFTCSPDRIGMYNLQHTFSIIILVLALLVLLLFSIFTCYSCPEYLMDCINIYIYDRMKVLFRQEHTEKLKRLNRGQNFMGTFAVENVFNALSYVNLTFP